MRPIYCGNGNSALFFYEHCSNKDIKVETATKAVTLASFHRNSSQMLYQEARDHA